MQGNALQIDPPCALSGGEIGRPGEIAVVPAICFHDGTVSIQQLPIAPPALHAQIAIPQALPAADRVAIGDLLALEWEGIVHHLGVVDDHSAAIGEQVLAHSIIPGIGSLSNGISCSFCAQAGWGVGRIQVELQLRIPLVPAIPGQGI